MGDEVEQRTFSRKDRQMFRHKVQECLDALAAMLADDTFRVDEPRLGMEIELNLVDESMQPAMANAAVLEAIADPDFQTELGQFNIEINVAPEPLAGDRMRILENGLRTSLDTADARAREQGCALAMIGMLPTLGKDHFAHQWLSSNPRYDLLNQQIFAARGEDIELSITGVPLPGSHDIESLNEISDTILPEAACTSVQLHLQVSPTEFPAHWNAAQALAGVQVALAANSPSSPARHCGTRPGSPCSNRRRTRAHRNSRTRECDPACGSASAGSRRSSIFSRRTRGISPRCCRSCPTRIRWPNSRRAERPA